MAKEIICIICPLGCKMGVDVEGNEAKSVSGNRCKKGLKHAQKEISFPGRVLTTTVSTNIPGVPLLPVRSNREIPKDKMLACMAEISKHQVSGIVKMGQPIVKNILGLGADIIASRSAPLRFPAATMGE